MQNKIQGFKYKFFFQKPKFHYKHTCKTGSVLEGHISQSVSSVKVSEGRTEAEHKDRE
jgi:hypothetical protein